MCYSLNGLNYLLPTHSKDPNGNSSTQLDTSLTYLKKIEVSVELGTFCVLQSFELSRDEHENVLETREAKWEEES